MEGSPADLLKNQIVDNQKLIDQLNSDLARKTQEVHIIQEVSSEITSTLDLDVILQKVLESLDKTFDFKHSMLLLWNEKEEVLHVAASHGYEDPGIGAQVKLGEGMIGVVAKRKKLMRMGNIATQMAYVNTVKTQFAAAGQEVSANRKLPGLANVQSQVAIPLLSEDRLIGVLAVESIKSNVFDKRDETIITILASQAASAIEKAHAHHELKRVNENLEELVMQRTSEVVAQKEVIELKNKDITASIRYAKRLQDALLPSAQLLNEFLGENFVLFIPKDIVSGDFYWINKKSSKTFFSAIDCTGHGVPGAFVSLTAHANLQRAVGVFGEITPAGILDALNREVIELFSRTNTDADLRDGMDIALCALNEERTVLEFAGANNPMYLLRGGELTEIKGDKQPIGKYEYSKNFSNHTLEVQKDDVIYLFSDGYADQFGGPQGKKFKYSKFKELLVSNYQRPLAEQKAIFYQAIEEWRGDHEQIDDILVMGIRI